MKRKIVAMALASTMAIGMLAGCGSSSSDTTSSDAATETTEEADEEETEADAEETEEEDTADDTEAASGDFVYRMGFVNISDADNCCYPCAQNFKETCESAEFAEAIGADSVEVFAADSALDIEKQTTNVETILSQGVDIMFIIGVDTEGNNTAVKECNEAGVPVFMVGTEATTGDWKFIGFDEYEFGAAQGEWAVENLPENCKICYMEGTTGREATVLRKQGFEETIAERDDLEIIASQTGDFDTATAMQVTEDWLTAYGDEIGCMVAADGKMTVGMSEALKSHGDTGIITIGNFSVGELDGYPVKDGDVSSAVFSDWPSIGFLCADVAKQVYLEGYDFVDERTNIELVSVTPDNWDEIVGDK